MGEDLRTIKTKKAIKQAFIDLVSKKGYNDISVTEIANAALVNRNTFYLHYDSKDHLVDSLMQENLKEQTSQMNIMLSRLIINPNNFREIYLYVSFKALLKLLANESSFYRVFLTDYSLVGYTTQIGIMIKKEINKFFRLNTPEEIVVSEYVCNGAWGIIKQWLLQDDKKIIDSIDSYANLLSKLIYSNYKIIKK